MHSDGTQVLKLGIIGAGFAGTALTALLQQSSTTPLEIILCDESGTFGGGDAYNTPYPFHLLNVRARDMSAFEHDPQHFVAWLTAHQVADSSIDADLPLADQFISRLLYKKYLQDLLTPATQHANAIRIKFIHAKVIDLVPDQEKMMLVLADETHITVDKVVLAVGNPPPSPFPFPVANNINCISNPWDYVALKQIATDDTVFIVGTGLSMIDAVLTLYHQQHRGHIYALSRHGLLPLPHTDCKVPFLLLPEQLPTQLRPLLKQIRQKTQQHLNHGGDWRSVINALRLHAPRLWNALSQTDKKRFLRHGLAYWNVHRHRVHNKTYTMLLDLQRQGQLTILAGRVEKVADQQVTYYARHGTQQTIASNWLINCMGPAQKLAVQPTLLQAIIKRGLGTLDALNLGLQLEANGALRASVSCPANKIFVLGPLRRNSSWEATAVPEIRKQIADIVQHLLSPTNRHATVTVS